MTVGWGETQTQTFWANVRCSRDECDNSKTETTKTATLHACLRVTQVFWVAAHLVGFRVVLRVDLVLRGRQWCSCRCDRPLNLYPKVLHISHRENGSFEVLSWQLLSVPRDNRLVAGETGCPLSPNLIIINSATLSHSPCGLLSWVEYHFVSDPGPRNDQRPAANLFAKKDKCGIGNTFLFIVFTSPHDVIENRHEDNSSLELFGFRPSCSWTVELLGRAAMKWILGNFPLEFHRFSVNCPKFCIVLNHWTNPTWLQRKVRFCGGVRVHIIIDDKLFIHGSPRTCVRHFTRFPLLRKPLVVNVPFWVVWWASAHTGLPVLGCCTFNELRGTFWLSDLVCTGLSDAVEASTFGSHTRYRDTKFIIETHNVLPEVDFESWRSPAKSESWNSPSPHCLAVLPTWQYCLYSQVWSIYEINRFRRLSQALVHFVMDRASLFTDHRISGLPIRAKKKHFRTIWEHTCDNSPTDFNPSSLKWWSSMHGVDTL